MKREEGITVVGESLTVEVNSKGDVKTILEEVDFTALPGRMLAIMGPSGSGKTTLLNVLAGRMVSSKTISISGSVYFDGNKVSPDTILDHSCYVMQEDVLLEYLTVRETLHYAANLLLGKKPRDTREARAEECLGEMGLDSCADVRIGGRSFKGISGGQKKRLSIAIALLSDPSVIFLDEPTSGLDASMSYDVCTILNNIAMQKNKTILCTIHQPRSQVFALFDDLLLLRDGKIVYRGLIEQSVPYFDSIGYKCPSDFNPPDFFLDLLSGGAAETPGGSESNILRQMSSHIMNVQPNPGIYASNSFAGDSLINYAKPIDKQGSIRRVTVSEEAQELLVEKFQTSELNRDFRENIKEILQRVKPLPESTVRPKPSPRTWLKSVNVLYRRHFRNERREPKNLFANMFTAIIMSIIFGTIYWKIQWPRRGGSRDPCDTTRLRNWEGAIMQVVGQATFTCFDAGVQTVARRPLVNRESSGGLYHRSAWHVASNLADGAFHYWPLLVLSTIIYWCCGLSKSFGDFVAFLFIAACIKFTYWGYSIFVGFTMPNAQACAALTPLIAVLFFLVTGYQMADDDIKTWLVWLKYISPARYFFQAMVRQQYKDNEYLNECGRFRTPDNVVLCCVYGLLVGLAFRVVALIAQLTLHKNVGVQV